jgi:serine/threonine protein kinase
VAPRRRRWRETPRVRFSDVNLSLAGSVPGVHWFRVGRVLGKGAFGKVIAVTKKDTRKNYACKLLDKVQVIEKNSFKSVLLERELLSTLECPFIVNLRLAYQTETDLCMVVDLMSGGDLRFHLSKEHFFEEERAKFYTACILLALEYIHGQRVLHRFVRVLIAFSLSLESEISSQTTCSWMRTATATSRTSTSVIASPTRNLRP